MRLTDISGQENLKEGSNKIIYTLDITTGWMTDGPNIKYSLYTLGRIFEN